MKASHDGPCPSKTAIHLEPMTDMPSSDYSCIYLIMPFWLENMVMILY